MDTKRENVESLGLAQAVRFLNLLEKYPFVAIICDETSYHLFTKGNPQEVEELMTALRDNG